MRDLVTHNSYNYDLLFEITDIKDEIGGIITKDTMYTGYPR